jgi:hypothetical protein
MTKLKYFGAKCSRCGEFVPMGKIDIDPDAPWSILRKLLKTGEWKDDREKRNADCEKCGTRTKVKRSETRLGDPVEPTPEIV